MSKVALVTGATRGLGKALAKELARRSMTVYGAGRSFKEGEEEQGFIPLVMDVTDDFSVAEGVSRITNEHGGLDILVNNAGISHSGAIEDVSLDVAKKIYEVNYLGVVRLLKAALPEMRKKGSGTVAIVGSAAGKIGVPYQAHYASSKFAVEGLSESLSHELRPFGIRVLLFEPGDVGTTIWDQSEHTIPEGSPYQKAMEGYHSVKEKEMEKDADPPERVAAQIANILLSGTTTLRHPVAKGAPLFMLARKLLPDSIFLWAVRKNYRIP